MDFSRAIYAQFVRDYRVIASARAIYPSLRGYFVTIYSNICNKYKFSQHHFSNYFYKNLISSLADSHVSVLKHKLSKSLISNHFVKNQKVFVKSHVLIICY